MPIGDGFRAVNISDWTTSNQLACLRIMIGRPPRLDDCRTDATMRPSFKGVMDTGRRKPSPRRKKSVGAANPAPLAEIACRLTVRFPQLATSTEPSYQHCPTGTSSSRLTTGSKSRRFGL